MIQRLLLLIPLMLLLRCGSPAPAIDAQAISENNRGVALMGYFDYPKAHEVFTQLAQRFPEWHLVQVNLAVATLNLQTQTSENEALAILAGVLAADPENLRAHYCTGLLNLYQGDTQAALARFAKVVADDPADGHAAYYLGQCHAREGDHEEAVKWYQKAIALDPYLRSAYYGLFQAYQRTGDRENAQGMMELFQKLDGNPQARQAEFKYTRMGPKANALTVDLPSGEALPAVPEGEWFASPRELVQAPSGWSWRRGADISITAADWNGDGQTDLFLANGLEKDGTVVHALLRAEGAGFVLDLDHPLAAVGPVNAVLWGDLENDGDVDLYLCRNGANQLWRNDGEGSWTEVGAATGTRNGEANTIDGLWLDADHDGDLDLFLVNADAPNELLNNNLDGTFRALGESQGIAGAGKGSIQVLAADLDNDRDTDLMVINAKPPHEIYLNDRLWNYTPADHFAALLDMPITAALAHDHDADGQVSLFTVSGSGSLQKWSLADGQFVSRELAGSASAPIALADLDGSGRRMVVFRDGKGWVALEEDGKTRQIESEAEAWSLVTLAQSAATGPIMVTAGGGGSPQLYAAGNGRHSFVAFAFSGKEDKGNSMRSNAVGIGTKFAVRSGSQWSAAMAFPEFSGAGQSLAPMSVGLGGGQTIDYVAIQWTDGVFQTELNLGPGFHAIAETQRQLSSCPVLFAWDGDRFSFVSDILGVAGMGYAIGPGQYSKPRPWENFQFPPGALKPKDGHLHIRIAEPMEEACYLDAVALTAYDLPQGWSMVLDERMGINAPHPTGKPLFYRDEILPVAAANDRGEDVVASLLERDFKAAPTPPVDRRFIGFLEREHLLEFRFPQVIDGAANPILVVDGWVEYPYSQTNFAAWQAGISAQAPTLEYRDQQGMWQTLHAQFGYPAGMPRRMSVPLNGIPQGVTTLRLRTNQEIYWDRIALAYVVADPGIPTHKLDMTAAVLTASGFAHRTTAAQRLPRYDYQKRVPLWDTRHQKGFYTRFGDVMDLVNGSPDDALAIFGPGEEVQLTFASPQASPPQGGSRVFVLESHGWCKDMDLFTQHGETLAPIPHNNQPEERRSQLHPRFNTRYRSGY